MLQRHALRCNELTRVRGSEDTLEQALVLSIEGGATAFILGPTCIKTREGGAEVQVLNSEQTL